MTAALWDSRHSPPDTLKSGTYQPIIPNCMPSSYPSRQVLIDDLALNTCETDRSAPVGGERAGRYCDTIGSVIVGEDTCFEKAIASLAEKESR